MEVMSDIVNIIIVESDFLGLIPALFRIFFSNLLCAGKRFGKKKNE